MCVGCLGKVTVWVVCNGCGYNCCDECYEKDYKSEHHREWREPETWNPPFGCWICRSKEEEQQAFVLLDKITKETYGVS